MCERKDKMLLYFARFEKRSKNVENKKTRASTLKKAIKAQDIDADLRRPALFKFLNARILSSGFKLKKPNCFVCGQGWIDEGAISLIEYECQMFTRA